MEEIVVASVEDPLVAGRDLIFDSFVKTMEVGRYQLPSPPKGVVVEFGVGEIRGYIERYRQHFRRAIAVDIDDYSEAYPGCQFVLSDGETVEIPDRTADLVASHSVLEHVNDIGKSLDEINRILKVWGWAFLTVRPLYYSHCGGHWGSAADDWEHLDPESKYFTPIGQRALNGLTMGQLLANVGRQPWRIAVMERGAHYTKQLPDHIRARLPELARDLGVTPVDLYTREFRLLVQKYFGVVDENIQFRN